MIWRRRSRRRSPSREKDLIAQLRKRGFNKSSAEQIAKAASGLDSGKKKAEEVIRNAIDDLRSLAGDLEKRLPIGRDGGSRPRRARPLPQTSATASRAKRTTKATASRAKTGARSTGAAAKTGPVDGEFGEDRSEADGDVGEDRREADRDPRQGRREGHRFDRQVDREDAPTAALPPRRQPRRASATPPSAALPPRRAPRRAPRARRTGDRGRAAGVCLCRPPGPCPVRAEAADGRRSLRSIGWLPRRKRPKRLTLSRRSARRRALGSSARSRARRRLRWRAGRRSRPAPTR